tara:strand:- start:203 stop:598 length:396 start_codon:yes stop_codon:yes gene_type:complete
MRGPIIKEHATLGTMAVNTTKTYRVKSDGRLLRVYFKFTAASSGTIGHTVKVKPVAHFSDGDVALASWPEDSASTTNSFIQPEQGEITGTNASASGAIYVLRSGASSEYEISITTDADTTITRLYVLSELI